MPSDSSVQSLTFNSRISYEDLWAVMGACEIVRIERGTWRTFVEFRSDESAGILEKKLDASYEKRRAEESERHRRKHDAIYEATAAKYWDGVLGIPAIETRRGKPTVPGYYFLDDHGKMQFVFPEDQP